MHTNYAVAQYTVLETNAKVNGIGEILHPYPSETTNLDVVSNTSLSSAQGQSAKFDIYKLIQPLPLCARMKQRFGRAFFVNISIHPPMLRLVHRTDLGRFF